MTGGGGSIYCHPRGWRLWLTLLTMLYMGSISTYSLHTLTPPAVPPVSHSVSTTATTTTSTEVLPPLDTFSNTLLVRSHSNSSSSSSLWRYPVFSSDYTISLLGEEEVQTAAELIVHCHYKPLRQRFPRSPRLLGLHFLDHYLAHHFRNSVRQGFRLRCPQRLLSPSCQRNEESIIFLCKKLKKKVSFSEEEEEEEEKKKIIVNEENEKDELVGLVEVYPTHTPYLCNLSILSTYRRQGLGRYLIHLVETFLREVWREEDVVLHVEEGNRPALAFYQALGYHRMGKIPPEPFALPHVDHLLSGGSRSLVRFYKPLITTARERGKQRHSPISSSTVSTSISHS